MREKQEIEMEALREKTVVQDQQLGDLGTRADALAQQQQQLEIRKPLLCKPHFISSSAHSHSQFAQIINRHNRSPQ